MREIIFRAWDIDNNRWRYGFYLESSGYHFIVEMNRIIETTAFPAEVLRTEVLRKGRWFVVDHKTVAEYTGLKDKNGKEIYEGDILNIHIDDGEPPATEYIVFAEGAFRCITIGMTWEQHRLSYSQDDATLGGASGFSLDEVEVIGNIYENKDLLK